MVGKFKDIDGFVEKFNSLVGKLDDIKLTKYEVRDVEDQDYAEVLVSPNGASIVYLENSISIFSLGTHTMYPEEFDPLLQIAHRQKQIISLNAALEAIGVIEVDRIPLLEILFKEQNGRWIPNEYSFKNIRVSVIPENNMLQFYITRTEEEK